MYREFTVIVERDSEGWLLAKVPELKGCHTQAKTQDQLIKRIKEAIKLFLEVENKNYRPVDFIGIQRVAV